MATNLLTNFFSGLTGKTTAKSPSEVVFKKPALPATPYSSSPNMSVSTPRYGVSSMSALGGVSAPMSMLPGGATPTAPFSSPVVPQVKAPAPVTPKTAPIPSVATAGVASTASTPVTTQIPQESTDSAQSDSAYAPPSPYTLPPELASAIATAENAYRQSLEISPEELSTQEDLDRLIEGTKKAFVNTEGQTIPIEFITGQMAQIERRANTLAEPLERKLGRIQAQRLASVDASKFALDRADKVADNARSEAGAARTEAESARRFGIEQSGKAADRSQAKLEADRAFEENKRQFGLNYAQKEREVAYKKAEEADKLSAEKEAKRSETLSNLQLVNDLINNPKRQLVTGLSRFTPSAFFPDANLAKRQSDQITSILSLENRQKLKGSGAISDFEARTLAAASTALNRDLSDEAYLSQLNKIKGAFMTASGLAAPVAVKDPKTGKVDSGVLTREEIDSAISQGFDVQYQ